MTTVGIYLTDIALTVVVSMGILAYVSKHLRLVLAELCGTEERGRFWLAFSNVTLVLVPLILALEYRPQGGPEHAVIFEMGAQL